MKRIILFLLCLAFCLPIFFKSTTVKAADNYLITIAENTVLQNVNDNGMAVYIDGIIYIPYTTIDSLTGLSVIYNEDNQFVTVYRLKSIVVFELDTGRTYDSINNRAAQVPAKMRNGVPYLPAAILASWTNMYFSFIDTTESGLSYPIVRLCSSTPTTSDSTVLRQNASKLKSVSNARDKKSGIGHHEPTVSIPERDLAIMFIGAPVISENSTFALYTLFDLLEEYKLSASFFFAEDELVPNAENLREIYARGFYPGIMLTDGENLLEQAQRCSELYAQLLHARIRNVCAPDLELTNEQKAELTNAGFLFWEAEHAPDASDISANKLMNKIREALQKTNTSTSILLYPNEKILSILPMFYSYLNAQNFSVIAMNEITKPF